MRQEKTGGVLSRTPPVTSQHRLMVTVRIAVRGHRQSLSSTVNAMDAMDANDGVAQRGTDASWLAINSRDSRSLMLAVNSSDFSNHSSRDARSPDAA